MTRARSARENRRPVAVAHLWLAANLMLGASAIHVSFAALAYAQSTSPPSITVAATLTAEAESQAPFPIQVGPSGALPRGSFVRVRGLPPLAALSAGHSIAPGAWAIAIAALPGLKITMPRAVTGVSEIAVSVVAIDGSVLAEAKSSLVVSAPSPPATAKVLSAGTPPPGTTNRAEPPAAPPPGAAPTLSAQERERAMRLVKRGDEQLAEGGIAQARLLYERAAEAGLALGAMSMAATYDPAELGRMGVQGLQPDRAAAEKWYERARQLGATEAAQRLQRLGAK